MLLESLERRKMQAEESSIVPAKQARSNTLVMGTSFNLSITPAWRIITTECPIPVLAWESDCICTQEGSLCKSHKRTSYNNSHDQPHLYGYEHHNPMKITWAQPGPQTHTFIRVCNRLQILCSTHAISGPSRKLLCCWDRGFILVSRYTLLIGKSGTPVGLPWYPLAVLFLIHWFLATYFKSIEDGSKREFQSRQFNLKG